MNIVSPMFEKMLRVLLICCVGYLVSCRIPEYEKITIRGSDTEVNMVLDLAEQYMSENPKSSIGVTGGGSGSGIASLLNGRTDIANSSRDLTPDELAIAQKRGIEIIPVVYAKDAIAIIINPAIPLDSMSIDVIKKYLPAKFQIGNH